MQATVDCFYPPGQVSPLLIEGIFRSARATTIPYTNAGLDVTFQLADLFIKTS
ncbi:MAG TPA: hypothetical protein VLJ41_17105 [Segetibacter sp.]|nr:hypothetical protein [Segetibacter sp.]